MFTNLQNANIKVNSWFVKKNRKENREMKLHFTGGKGSRSDLQVAVSGWENKVMGTESDKKV